MIDEIKKIVQNYLNNAKLCSLAGGVVEDEGIRLSDKLVVPFELISGNLKDFIKTGDKVKLIRNTGGQEFYIVEVVGFAPATKERTITIEPITVSEGMTISSFKIKEVVK